MCPKENVVIIHFTSVYNIYIGIIIEALNTGVAKINKTQLFWESGGMESMHGGREEVFKNMRNKISKQNKRKLEEIGILGRRKLKFFINVQRDEIFLHL